MPPIESGRFSLHGRRVGVANLRSSQQWVAPLCSFVFSIALAMPFLTDLTDSAAKRSSESHTGETVLLVVGVSITMLITSAAVLWALFGTNRTPSGVTVLAYRSDAPTWWEQNRSAVILSLVTNAVVGVIFFALGIWVGG